MLALTATIGACTGGDDDEIQTAAPTTTAAPATTAAPPPTETSSTATAPTASTRATATLPRPIAVVHQGDRVFGVYWVGSSQAELAPVARRLRALGYPASTGDLDCDRGARRWLGLPASVTSKVAVYFGTEQDARAFAEGVDVQPRPEGHAAAILYCLD